MFASQTSKYENKMEKKADTKNQHYVPQFYQRNFSINEKRTIGVYLFAQNKYIPTAAIKHQASADYYYSTNMKIEEALGALEKLAATAIDKIKQAPICKLADKDAMALYVFTMIQISRTPAFVKMLTDNVNKMCTMMLRKYVEAVRKTDQASEVEEITDEILDCVSIDLKEPGRSAIGIMSQAIDICFDMLYGAKLLINKTSKAFITSDNPACMYDQHFERIGQLNYALGSSGLQIYLPLTPTLAIMYYDNCCYKIGSRKKHYVEIEQEKDVDQLNRLVACTADEVIFCRDGDCSISELENYAKAHKKYHITDPVQTFETKKNENSEIFGATNVTMYCKMHLSFIKELPNYKAKTSTNFDYCKDRLRKSAYLLNRYPE